MITGVSGFIGCHLVSELVKQGYYVVGVDKRPYPKEYPDMNEFIQTDVFDLGFRDLMDIDYVIHLAFITNIPNSVRHPVKTTYQNIDMTVHLLQMCKEAGVKRLLFPSTVSLYANNPIPWTEDMTPEPIEPYSWQKMSCEYLCKMYDIDTIIFRFFQVFGSNQRPDTALAYFLKAKEDDKPITLTKTSVHAGFKSGQRDFVYVGDLAKAVILAMEKGKNNEIYNVASGDVTTMEEIAKTIGAKIEWIPRRDWEVERHEGDISKLKALGWKPETKIIPWLKEYVKHNKK